jgi:hypothetical protein
LLSRLPPYLPVIMRDRARSERIRTLKDDPDCADGVVVGLFTTGVSGDLIIRPIIEKASNAP